MVVRLGGSTVQWAVVAHKLVNVTNIVIGVGKSCRIHGLGEEDLAHLQITLQPFRKCVESIPSTCSHLLTHDKDPRGDWGIAQGVRRDPRNQEKVNAHGDSNEGQTMRRHVVACT
jgi:hypothetical protein